MAALDKFHCTIIITVSTSTYHCSVSLLGRG